MGLPELLLLITGLMVIVAIPLVIVRGAIGGRRREQLARTIAQLESAGIVRRSEIVGGSVRYRHYRAPGVYRGAGISATRAGLVLTREELVVVGGHAQRIPVAALGKYVVTVQDGKLVLATDDPPGATGHVALHLRLPDAEAWAKDLRQAGARTS